MRECVRAFVCVGELMVVGPVLSDDFFTGLVCYYYTSKQMKEAWDERRTVQHNLRDMGLSDDPNKTLARPVVS